MFCLWLPIVRVKGPGADETAARELPLPVDGGHGRNRDAKKMNCIKKKPNPAILSVHSILKRIVAMHSAARFEGGKLRIKG